MELRKNCCGDARAFLTSVSQSSRPSRTHSASPREYEACASTRMAYGGVAPRHCPFLTDTQRGNKWINHHASIWITVTKCSAKNAAAQYAPHVHQGNSDGMCAHAVSYREKQGKKGGNKQDSGWQGRGEGETEDMCSGPSTRLVVTRWSLFTATLSSAHSTLSPVRVGCFLVP